MFASLFESIKVKGGIRIVLHSPDAKNRNRWQTHRPYLSGDPFAALPPANAFCSVSCTSKVADERMRLCLPGKR